MTGRETEMCQRNKQVFVYFKHLKEKLLSFGLSKKQNLMMQIVSLNLPCYTKKYLSNFPLRNEKYSGHR